MAVTPGPTHHTPVVTAHTRINQPRRVTSVDPKLYRSEVMDRAIYGLTRMPPQEIIVEQVTYVSFDRIFFYSLRL